MNGEHKKPREALSEDPMSAAWREFHLAWCKLRALAEEGGATMTMDIKVKGAPKKKRSKKPSKERCTCGERGCSQCGEDPRAYGFV